MFKKCVIGFAFVAMLCFGLEDLGARGRSGGGFKSSSSRSSSSRSTPSRTSSSNRSSPSKSFTSSRTKTQATKSTVKRSPAQQKSYEKAKSSGKAFSSKKAAVSDFKSKNASKYTSKYKTEPAKRPDHIPQTSKVDGKTVNITYNQNSGGYGYWGGGGPGLGTFMLYDAMSDAVMVNAMMSRQGYYYDTPGTHVVHHNNNIGRTIFFVIFLFIVLGILVVCIVNSTS